MTTYTVAFHVSDDDVAEIHRALELGKGHTTTPQSRFVAVLQEALYDSETGPQLEGTFSIVLDPMPTPQIKTAEDITHEALAVWEVLDESPKEYPAFNGYRDAHGVAETRDRVYRLARKAGEIWDAGRTEGTGFDVPFDWEFVPLFLKYCTDATDPDGDLQYLMDGTPDGDIAAYFHILFDAESATGMARQSLKALVDPANNGPIFAPGSIRRTL